jgi:hypothetical protein
MESKGEKKKRYKINIHPMFSLLTRISASDIRTTYLPFFYFLLYWDLNSGPYKAGALPLEYSISPPFFTFFVN